MNKISVLQSHKAKAYMEPSVINFFLDYLSTSLIAFSKREEKCLEKQLDSVLKRELYCSELLYIQTRSSELTQGENED